MKLQILGSGSIGSSYFNACTLVNDEIMIDLPNGILKYMKKLGVSIESVRYILITHLHGDHFMDLPFYMLYKFMNKLSFETVIYGPVGLVEKVKQIYEVAFPGDYEKIIDKVNIKFIEHEGMENIDLSDNVVANSVLVDHGSLKPAYGYIISDGEKVAGFSGDSILVDSIEKILDESDIAVLDASMPYEGNPSHMGLSDIEYLCNKYSDKKIVCTHMGDGARERAQNLDIKNIIVPDDGKIIMI